MLAAESLHISVDSVPLYIKLRIDILQMCSDMWQTVILALWQLDADGFTIILFPRTNVKIYTASIFLMSLAELLVDMSPRSLWLVLILKHYALCASQEGEYGMHVGMVDGQWENEWNLLARGGDNYRRSLGNEGIVYGMRLCIFSCRQTLLLPFSTSLSQSLLVFIELYEMRLCFSRCLQWVSLKFRICEEP